MGQHGRTILGDYYVNAVVTVIFLDKTNAASLRNARLQARDIYRVFPDMILILCGTNINIVTVRSLIMTSFPMNPSSLLRSITGDPNLTFDTYTVRNKEDFF